MKRKLFAILLAASAAVVCAFGFAACGVNDNAPPEPTALEKAYADLFKTPNFTATVTDSRTQKHGKDFSGTVEVDVAHNTAHHKDAVFEHYEEIVYDNGIIKSTRYHKYITVETENGKEVPKVIWEKGVNTFPSDFDENSAVNQYLCRFANGYLPALGCNDMGYGSSAESTENWVSVTMFPQSFTESANESTANINVRLFDNNENDYKRYACTVTVKFDGRGRFLSVDIDFGTNGKISSAFSYGTANVTVPEIVKNATANTD